VSWSTRDVDRVLRRAGFVLARRASHDVYTKEGHRLSVAVPRDVRDIPLGTVRGILFQADISRDDADRLRQ
jgi:predicted RNA binding protein YcfA (HicA-like mRNA interferase family)